MGGPKGMTIQLITFIFSIIYKYIGKKAQHNVPETKGRLKIAFLSNQEPKTPRLFRKSAEPHI